MRTTPLGPGFAVEVSGIDPSAPIADDVAEELRALLDRHQLLVVRAPGLGDAEQRRFVGLFGPVFDEARDGSGYSKVSNVVGVFPNGRLLFHQDFAFTPYPHRVQSLYAEEVVGGVAPTLFTSNLQAFERLSPAQREAWAGLTAVHARDAARKGSPDDEFVRVELRKRADADDRKRYPQADHPVIFHHPRTGAPLLFVSEYFTSHIHELPPEEGEQVIQDAIALLYHPADIYAHEWRPGDLVMWDNIALQHARSAVRPDTRRTLRRMLVNDHVGTPEHSRQPAEAMG